MVNLKRMFRSGLLNFARNGMVSLASVLIMTITLSVVTGIFLFEHVLETTLINVENKVDVSVYFLPGIGDSEIQALKSKVDTLPQVASTEYISEKEALEDFRARHQNDQTTLQALDELDTNPIGAMLNINAKDISQYESIAKFFNDGTTLDAGAQSIIDHVSYNKAEIDIINGMLNKGRTLGFAMALVLMILSVIITFNTIRLAIYFSREEISVMRLVGGSRTQVHGPFYMLHLLFITALKNQSLE
jgi:cell division transport system permease protein